MASADQLLPVCSWDFSPHPANVYSLAALERPGPPGAPHSSALRLCVSLRASVSRSDTAAAVTAAGLTSTDLLVDALSSRCKDPPDAARGHREGAAGVYTLPHPIVLLTAPLSLNPSAPASFVSGQVLVPSRTVGHGAQPRGAAPGGPPPAPAPIRFRQPEVRCTGPSRLCCVLVPRPTARGSSCAVSPRC